MVSSTRQAIACLLVIFGVAVLAHGQTLPVKEPTSTISGRITVKDKPAAGVAVGLRVNDPIRSQPVSHRAITNENGEYKITNVPAGSYWMAVSAPAFVIADETGGQRSLLVNKGETIENIDFTLLRGGVITGKIVDSEGRALIQQQVFLLPENDRGRTYYSNIQTDDRGIYRAFGVPPGNYRVAAGNAEEDSFGARYQAGLYRRIYYPNVSDASQAKVIQVSEGSEATNIDIVLSRTVTTYTATGRIVDEAGQPVPNVPYAVSYFISENSTHTMSSGAVSNARGEFRLENIAPGKYAAMIRSDEKGELHADQVRFEITDQDVTGLVMVVKKAASISGVIVVEGNDVKSLREQLMKTGVSVSVANSSPERGGWGHFTRFAEDGSFRIGGLPAGTATFHISSQYRFHILRVERDGVIQPRGVEIREHENVTGIRLIAAYANASIRGTIQVQNGTLPSNTQFSVWLNKLGDDPRQNYYSGGISTQVDARGQFVIEGLLPGMYEVNAGIYIPGRRLETPHTKQEVVVTAGAVTKVNLTLDLSSLPANP
ncbi:MAG TPA: carboxypeptidase regulatory-like domain-containing protein [Pyrinomonadaceae bacterium]|nr:carboxypeptidase regulatory-like domain-containing protein [Pyrinomonadaceae bacterium]